MRIPNGHDETRAETAYWRLPVTPKPDVREVTVADVEVTAATRVHHDFIRVRTEP